MAAGHARSAALGLAAAVLGSLCLVALSEDGAYDPVVFCTRLHACVSCHDQCGNQFYRACAEQLEDLRFVQHAQDAPLVSHFNYIVVGGGTSGCPLAATLS